MQRQPTERPALAGHGSMRSGHTSLSFNSLLRHLRAPDSVSSWVYSMLYVCVALVLGSGACTRVTVASYHAPPPLYLPKHRSPFSYTCAAWVSSNGGPAAGRVRLRLRVLLRGVRRASSPPSVSAAVRPMFEVGVRAMFER